MSTHRSALAALVVSLSAACSSTPASTACPHVDGTYELTVSPTGQSENLGGACADAGSQVIDLSIMGTAVSVAGQSCTLCASASCQFDVLCGSSVTCPGSFTPPPDAGDGYVQTVTFVAPTNTVDASANAFVELGPNFCGYEGAAVRKGP